MGIALVLLSVPMVSSATIIDDIPDGWSTDTDDYQLFYDFEDANTSAFVDNAFDFGPTDFACFFNAGLVSIGNLARFYAPNSTIFFKANYSKEFRWQSKIHDDIAFAGEAGRFGFDAQGANTFEIVVNGQSDGLFPVPFRNGTFMFEAWFYNGTAGSSALYINDTNTSNRFYHNTSRMTGNIGDNYTWTSRSVDTIGACFDYVLVYDGFDPPQGVVVDTSPPINFSWNVTSNNTFVDEATDVWNISGAFEVNISSNLLSLTVSTDEASNGSCRTDIEQNHNQMIGVDSNYKFTTTETTSHSFTIIDNVTALTSHCLYCSFIDALGNGPAENTSSSGCLNFTFKNDPPVPIAILNPPNGSTVAGLTNINWSFNDTDIVVFEIFLQRGKESLYAENESILIYRFEEGAGSVAVDSTSNQKNGTIVGTGGFVASNGSNGTGSFALDFPAENENFINVSADALIANLFQGGGTLSMWILPHSVTPFGRVFDKQRGIVDLRTPAKFSFFRDFDGVDGQWTGQDGNVQIEVWQHLIFVYNSSNLNAPQGYINNVLGNVTVVQAPSGSALDDSTVDLMFGNREDLIRPINATFDEIAFFNFTFSAQNVSDVFNNGLILSTQERIDIGNVSAPNISIQFNFSTIDIGEYELFVIAHDSLNQTGQISHDITVEEEQITIPIVTLLNLTNDSIVEVIRNSTLNQTANITFNFSVNINSNCSLFLNNVLNISVLNATGTTSFNPIEFNPSNNSWFTNCTSTNSNITSASDEFIFEIRGVQELSVPTTTTLPSPINETNLLSRTSCIDTTAGVLILLLIFAIAIFLMFLGFGVNEIFGIFGSLLFIVLGWFIFPCILIAGLIVIVVGVVALFYFGFTGDLGG